jgi:CRP-like cAMP-binding protein
MAGFWFVIWAASYQPLPLADTVFWNFASMIINIKMAFEIFYAKRPIVFSEELEKVYTGIFEGIMSRAAFRTLSKAGLVRDLAQGRFYAVQGDTISNLSILIEGQIQVLKHKELREYSVLKTSFVGARKDQNEEEMKEITGKSDAKRNLPKVRENDINSLENLEAAYAFISALDFIDSPEWFMKQSNEAKKFQVSLQATIDCKYLMWPAETLADILSSNPDIKTPLLGVLGIDVSRKIFHQDKDA